MILRDYQIKAIDGIRTQLSNNTSTLLVMATGLGKCFGRNTPVLMLDGAIKNVQDIKMGDQLIGPDSKPRLVTSTTTGREMMYRITPKKGEPYIVNESHILSLKITNISNTRVKNVYDSIGNKYTNGMIANIDIKSYLASSTTFKHVAKGWKVGVDFNFTSLGDNLPPYILGIWLGDGTSTNCNITNPDFEIVNELQQYADKNNLIFKKLYPAGKAWTYTFKSKTAKWYSNKFYESLKFLNLLQNKHIPPLYKSNNRETRLELLAGIIDADGSFFDGCYDYISARKQLSEDVAYLARSLGLAAYVKKCHKTCCNNGVVGTYYRVCISGNTNIIPCRVKRKQAIKRKQKKDVLITSISLNPIGIDDYFGFEITGTDRLFLLGDFTVVHNTVAFAAFAKECMPLGRILVLAHREELIYQAYNKMTDICGVEPDIEMGEYHSSRNPRYQSGIVISTIQTQIAGMGGEGRMTKFNPNDFSLVIVDEVHHVCAATYKRVLNYYKKNPLLKILGVTATPDRADEEALGQILETVAFEYGILEGINDGYLVPISQRSVYVDGLDYSKIRTTAGDLNGGDLEAVLLEEKPLHRMAQATIECSMRLAPNTLDYVFDLSNHEEEMRRLILTNPIHKSLIFTVTVAHAERFTEILNRWIPESARWVCGKTPKDDRKKLFKDYADKKFPFLVNVNVTTEGFDDPSIELIIMGQPTKSRSRYAQQTGRGTRPLTGIVDGLETPELRKQAIQNSEKKCAEIVDFVGNAGRHKLITTADILGGNYPDEGEECCGQTLDTVVERAKKNTEGKSGIPADVITELRRAEREIKEEKRRLLEERERKKVIVNAKYSTATVNPFDRFDLTPRRVPAWHRGRPPSEKMMNYLERNNIDPAGLSFTHASQLVQHIMDTKAKAPCSEKQARVLKKYGFSPELTGKQASVIIQKIADNQWSPLIKSEREEVLNAIASL